jgi:hypothetical protein
MGLLPQCPIHEGPTVGSQYVHQAVYTECTNPIVKEEVFNYTADNMRLIPVHSTPVLSRFGTSVVQEDKARSAASCRVDREMA